MTVPKYLVFFVFTFLLGPTVTKSFCFNGKLFARIGQASDKRASMDKKTVCKIHRLHPGITRGDGDELSTGSLSSASLSALKGGSADSNENKSVSSRGKAIQELVAEFIGTFLIVQIGCGTVCSAIFKSAQTGLWQIAAVWSIAVTLAISTTAAVSGAHLNPAITLSLALLRGFQWRKVLPFVAAQTTGAFAAAGVNFVLFRDSISSFESANAIVRGAESSIASASAFGEYWSVSSWLTAFIAEAYGTAILAFVIFALTHPRNKTMADNTLLVPPLIGATVGALISVIAPLTQGGFNPARDFGPRILALIAGWGRISMKGAWLYIAAPLVGAPIGALIAEKLLYANTQDE